MKMVSLKLVTSLLRQLSRPQSSLVESLEFAAWLSINGAFTVTC